MAYNNYFPVGYQGYPQIYPQQNPVQPQPQQNNGSGIVWVQGIEGAKAHPVAPGQAVLLMDSDSDCMYLKSADMTGMPTLRVFDYTERKNDARGKETLDVSEFATKEDISVYVTKEELKSTISDLEKKLKGKKKDE